MKILHTSDWHLGRSLYGRKRYSEFSLFLDWLADTIKEQSIDALLVAGDVFDTSTPSNRAQELYYQFLCRVSASDCRHIVVIAGNHDSPSFLDAPKELLKALRVHVVGGISENLEDEVIVLKSHSETEADEKVAIVCAVPYLRDRDIRTVEAGETLGDKNKKLIEGIEKHYAGVVSIAEKKRNELLESAQATNKKIPLVAMGHLFTSGGKTVDGDGVRELYVGSLAHVNQNTFPASIDYLALGHLHSSQCVGDTKHLRYCGSPIPMGYGEANQDKKVIVVEFGDSDPLIEEIVVPCFQSLERVVGGLDEIQTKLKKLKREKSQAWIEIEYTGQSVVGNLREMLEESLLGTEMEILRVKNKRLMDRVVSSIEEDKTLDDLDVNDVFERCLETFEVPSEERIELTASYKEIVSALQEEDKNAE